MSEKQGAVEAAASAAATATKFTYTTYTTAGVGVFSSWLYSVDWVAVLGVSIALATFLLNLYYKRKENQRADEIHKLTKQKLEQPKEENDE
ncbi:hypothetical protein F889_01526 [Acinetobacter colistiniresistens]|uniref:Holin n=1 Tax=Acinetobacter colistiniresistens TaxID=280145 RepID=N9QXS7_9GAMM|nr:holin [Acinetobacter colistiniresistens]ENX34886.1 hypothetical protein F889_01526 [Acinetobacter colistiniresistens]